MRYLLWFLRIVLFVLLLGFAVKNTETVMLRYYFDYQWQAPLMMILLFFFALGVAIGALSCLSKIFRQRREIATLRKSARPRIEPGDFQSRMNTEKSKP